MNIEDTLDHRARALHAAGLAQVPFSVSTQLQPRASTHKHSAVWRPVMVGAMVLALAGVGILQMETPASKAPKVDTVVQTAPAPLPASSPTTALDNDPEFYAWLGSDANTLHMEK